MKAREKYEPEKSERRHVLGSKCRKKQMIASAGNPNQNIS